MNRRQFLGSVVGGMVSFVTGCVSSGGGGSESDATTMHETILREKTPTQDRVARASTSDSPQNTAETSLRETEEPPLVGQEGDWSDKSKPQMQATIGSQSQLGERNQPHSIHVWNDTPNARSIQIKILPTNNSEQPDFQETYRIKPDSFVALELMRPGDFVIRVGVDDKSKKAGRADVDCNSSITQIGVRKDGSVDSTTVSTAVACAGEMGTTVTEESRVETQEATR